MHEKKHPTSDLSFNNSNKETIKEIERDIDFSKETYSNDKYRFKIKYPNNWNIEAIGDNIFLDPKTNTALMRITFENKVPEEWISDKERMGADPYEEVVSKETYAMNGVDGTLKVVHRTSLGINRENIIIPHMYGIIVFSFPETTESTNKAFESVIDTFERY